MIPKIVHRIWFGDLPMPPDYERYWAGWRRQLPEYEFRTWRDEDIGSLTLTCDKIAEAHGMSRKADVARYEILLRHGGIYLDCDMMPYQHLDFSSLRAAVVVCNETASDSYCSVGFVGAAPGAAVFDWAVRNLRSRPLNITPPHRETGPWFFREAMAHGEYLRLPSDAFYPYLYTEPYSRILFKDLSRTYGIHIWGGSWLGDKEKQHHALLRLRHGSLSGLADAPDQAALSPYCDAARAARTAAVAAVRRINTGVQLQVTDPTPFEFLKVCFHLARSNPDALVWQIGAADGILVDPLRPLLVNFDLPAVLLEPNPYLFEDLVRNYRHNSRTRLVNAALARATGSLVLNAANPQKARERGLPEWVAGISSFYRDRNAIGGLTVDAELRLRINECVEPVAVRAIDLPALLDTDGGRHPDIVVIDAEGMDAVIVEMMLEAGIRPLVLLYEAQCLTATEAARLARALAAEYVLFPFGNDTVAYRRDLFFSYCDHLYIEEGYACIYAEGLRFVMRV